MTKSTNGIGTFIWRVTSVHVITYFIAGILALYIFNYEVVFATGVLGSFMKPLDSPWVASGSGLQVFRGLVFGFVLWPFRSVILEQGGWIKLWLLFIGLSILSTFGPAPGSIDGIIYTRIPIGQQLLFLPELFFQSFLLSFFVYSWYSKPKKVYNIISIILITLILFMSAAAFFVSGSQ